MRTSLVATWRTSKSRRLLVGASVTSPEECRTDAGMRLVKGTPVQISSLWMEFSYNSLAMAPTLLRPRAILNDRAATPPARSAG